MIVLLRGMKNVYKNDPLKDSSVSLFSVKLSAIFVICNDSSLQSQPIIFNPDFFVEAPA